MKRVLIRMSALATVVVLGWIAIAQAQRDVDDTSGSSTSQFGRETESADLPGSGPILAKVRTAAPRNLPADVRANPLRSPSADAKETSSTHGRSGGASRYADAEAATAARAGDPFGLRPATAEQPAEPAPGQPEVRPAGGIGSIAPQKIITEAPGGASRYPINRDSGPAHLTEVTPGVTSPNDFRRSTPEETEEVADAATAAGPKQTEAGRPGNTLSAPNPNAPGEVTAGGDAADNANRGAPAAAPQFAPRALTDPPDGAAPLQTDSQPGSAADASPTANVQPNHGAQLGPSAELGADNGSGYSDLGFAAGTGTPGGEQLEGPQSPQVSIEKIAPAEIQVGKTASFEVIVRNTGSVPARDVTVRDQVPKGARLITTSPPASRGTTGDLVWSIGTLSPGDEVTVQMQIMPLEEGEIGSVATVHLAAGASARTIATKPELQIQADTPAQVLIGEEFVMSITVSNPGSGPATGVVLEERVPPELQHAAGAELEYEVGRLEPGETRQLELRLSAARAGKVANMLTARGDGNLRAEHQQEFEVVAPQLELAIDGPSRRYLEREATYQLAISNPGTAPANEVEVVVYLPEGLDFVDANNAGHYEPTTRTVHWQLEELPTGETGAVELVAMPVDAGEYKLRYTGSASRGLVVEKEHDVTIEGIAAILFEVVDLEDPVEAGGETTYEIRVLNQGSKAATNVQLAASLAPGIRPIAAEGPTQHSLQPHQVVFESLARLAPKADTTYRIRVQGLQPGDQRIRVQLLTDQVQTPVTKEESTRVYSDE